MTLILNSLSTIGLALTLIPSFFVLAGILDLDINKNLMMLGTVLWFSTVPFWINKVQEDSRESGL
jgi:hypothetical protein